MNRMRDHRRRGSMYVAVMGVSMLVMAIGLSSLMVTRIDRRTATINGETLAACSAARSMFEVALLRMNKNSSWRTTYIHNTWTLPEEMGEATANFKLFDEVDADLTNNSVDPVRLFAKAVVGETVRIYSVLVVPEETPNLLENGGMEAGPLGWTGESKTGLSKLSPYMDVVQSGAASLLVANRNNKTAGPNQKISKKITNGTTYYTEVWVKGTTDANQKLIVIDMDTTDGVVQSSVSASWFGQGWQKVSSSITPTWTGTLDSALWRVESASGTFDFMIDGALFVEGTGPPAPQMVSVPGTWQREPAS